MQATTNKFFKVLTEMHGPFKDGFSIVLCTHNGQGRLEPTLNHIAALAIPANYSAELVLINNASTDNTKEFVAETWQKLGHPFSLRVIDEKRPGKGYAVETGYDAACYSFILTVDDDNWLSADYLENALPFLLSDPEIGILQGYSVGVYESEPPSWFREENFEHYFVIGPPISKPGYYPKHNYGAWGAGMVLRKADWAYLRSLGFGFLTSKIPGKAAGEDHELSIALLMLGRRIYYSDQLMYRHFMPTARVDWDTLRKNFQTFGYVSHYNFLYALALDAYEKEYTITGSLVRKAFVKYFLKSVRRFTLKQYMAYWIKPQKQYYQLRLRQYFSQYKWFFKLSGNVMRDIKFLQNWMYPLLKAHPGHFRWPGKVY